MSEDVKIVWPVTVIQLGGDLPWPHSSLMCEQKSFWVNTMSNPEGGVLHLQVNTHRIHESTINTLWSVNTNQSHECCCWQVQLCSSLCSQEMYLRLLWSVHRYMCLSVLKLSLRNERHELVFYLLIFLSFFFSFRPLCQHAVCILQYNYVLQVFFSEFSTL